MFLLPSLIKTELDGMLDFTLNQIIGLMCNNWSKLAGGLKIVTEPWKNQH